MLENKLCIKDFLTNNNISRNLQSAFRQHYFTFSIVTAITDCIGKSLDDDGNIGCGVCVDLQELFDTVDHRILLAKLNHYGIRGVSNDWCKPYLSIIAIIVVIMTLVLLL